ncbi:MAG: NTP transferase domain-containing protein [Pseudomonadota bacterium]
MVYIEAMTAMAMTGEHALDVLTRVREWQIAGRDAALVIVLHTEGGAVRAPGALLAVSEVDHIGYISGGCIDADVALQARQAITDGALRKLRYGAGSPFVDLPLPCGGAITVLIVPHPALDVVVSAETHLRQRDEIYLSIDEDGNLSGGRASRCPQGAQTVFHYSPKLRIRIAGRGADALALAQLSHASGFETHIQLADEADIEAARQIGLTSVEPLATASDLAPTGDDAWTAFVLLFHDQDWEVPLLTQAIEGPAFYIGAVGSARTHSKRVAALIAAGVPQNLAQRVKGPIGLVPSLRDASLLAVSILSEIIAELTHRTRAKPKQTALVLLAAGASNRFEAGDKLLAHLDNVPLLTKAAALRAYFPSKQAIAVIPAHSNDRRDLLETAGWTVIENTNAALGQSTSLQAAMSYLNNHDELDQVVVLLGDMPNVTGPQIEHMIAAAEAPETRAVMSECDGVLTPPALFKQDLFDALSTISGDRGAKSVFTSLSSGAVTISISRHSAMDVDRVADLERIKEVSHV